MKLRGPTIAELNEELARAGKRLIEAERAHYDDPEYRRLLKLADARLKIAKKNNEQRVEIIQDEIADLKLQILDRKEQCARKRKSTWVPPELWPKRVREFLAGISRGVDWGVSPFQASKKHWQIRWISPGKRFVIITRPGHGYWSGRGCQQAYGAVDHWLVDLQRFDAARKVDSRGIGAGMELQKECTLMQFEGGKLTRDRKKRMIDHVREVQQQERK